MPLSVLGAIQSPDPEIEGIIRQLLQIIFTSVATKGFISSDHIQTFTGAGVAVAITAWSYYRAREQKQQTAKTHEALLANQQAIIAAVDIASRERVKNPHASQMTIPEAKIVVEEKLVEQLSPEAVDHIAPALVTNGHGEAKEGLNE